MRVSSRTKWIADRSLRVTLVALCVAFVVACGWVCDDAFITFRVVRNVWNGEGIVWNPGWRVQVFSHPLWMLLLTALQPITRSPWLSSMILSAVCTAASAWILLGVLTRRIEVAVLAFAVWVSSKALVEFSTSGLETPLTIMLLLSLVLALDRRAMRAAGWIGGLLLLNRLDAIVWVLPLCVFMEQGRTERLRIVGRVLVPALAWMVLSAVYFGSPWPNPAVAKAAMDLPLAVRLSNGRALLSNGHAWDPALAMSAILALSAAWTARHRDESPVSMLGPLIGASIAGLLYVIGVGGDFMSGRFLVVPALLMLVAGARALDRIFAADPRLTVMWALVTLSVGAQNPHGPLLAGAAPPVPVMDERGIADERTFAAATTGVAAWLAGRTTFESSGTGPPTPGEVQVVSGAGGAGYGASRGLVVVDTFAIADPFLARLPVRFEGGRVGHLPRPILAGYVESLRDGQNHVADADAALCFQRVRDAATLPVGASAQLAAAARLSALGCSDLWRGRWLDPEGEWHER